MAHQLAKADEYFAEAQQKRRQNNGYETKETFELEGKAHRISQNASYLDTALGALWGRTLPLASAQIALQHADYAKNAAGHITAGQLYRIDCSGPAAQYYCKDGVGDKSVKARITGNKEDKTEDKRFPWSRDKRVAWDGSAQEIYFDDPKSLARLEADGKKIVRSNPGIYNSKEDAFRNAVKQNPEAARKGNLYVVVNNPTYEVVPLLSEVGFYAAYDKLNDKMGGIMPLTKAEKTNVFLNQYAKNHGIKMESSNHSRGGITESVSLQYTNNQLNIKGIPLEKVRFYGTATNVADYISQTEKNGYVDEDGIQTTVSSAVHNADFVGRPPFILGGNPPTGGDCIKCYAHSSYYAWVPQEYLQDASGVDITDANGQKIKNPEYQKYTNIWGEPPKDQYGNLVKDQYGKPFNASAPKITIYDKNNKAHHIDYLGREIMQSKSGELKYLPVKTDIINGKKYIEFEGKKYHADVY